jgi:hypothetical protein
VAACKFVFKIHGTSTYVTKENPILLIPPGHASHKSLEATELVRMSRVMMVTRPPHTTHKLQVCDIAIVL